LNIGETPNLKQLKGKLSVAFSVLICNFALCENRIFVLFSPATPQT